MSNKRFGGIVARVWLMLSVALIPGGSATPVGRLGGSVAGGFAMDQAVNLLIEVPFLHKTEPSLTEWSRRRSGTRGAVSSNAHLFWFCVVDADVSSRHFYALQVSLEISSDEKKTTRKRKKSKRTTAEEAVAGS
jgi:hypothetical protein